MSKNEMLEPKRVLRVAVDYFASFVRAAAEGTKEFLDSSDDNEPIDKRASRSVVKFFSSASSGVERANETLTDERNQQSKEHSAPGRRNTGEEKKSRSRGARKR